MRSPEQLRAIFASYAKRRITAGNPEAILERRTVLAQRLRAARKRIQKARKRIGMPSGKDLKTVGVHIRSHAGLLSKARERQRARSGQQSVDWGPIRHEGSEAAAKFKTLRRRVAQKRAYQTMRSLGMTKTRYGWE